MIEQYLEDLESRIDDETEQTLWSEWKQFVDTGVGEGFFHPTRRTAVPPRVQWPAVPTNDTLENFELMALQQLGVCSGAVGSGNGALLDIRANYGTGILPTVFGAKLYTMPPDMNTLPTSLPLEGGVDEIRRVVDKGVPDLTKGLGARVFETTQGYLELLKNYPKLQKYVRIYHPDLQGPFDVCELLWGSSVFLALMDVPELVHALLDLISETYVQFLRRWFELVPQQDGCSPHWGMLQPGHIMLRDDSAMNLSPAMFAEFIRPYDARLLREFGGGAMHFCGKGDHYIAVASESEGLSSVNLSQPHLNDMETIYRNTVDKGIRILAFSKAVAEAAIAGGRDLRGLVHCP